MFQDKTGVFPEFGIGTLDYAGYAGIEQTFCMYLGVNVGELIQVGPDGNRGYLAMPADGSGPGVLVLHAWWGLTEVFTDVCDRLAGEGYVALAPGLYPGGETTASIEEAEALVDEHDSKREVVEGIARAALQQMSEMPAVTGEQVGVIGFSMGAYWALHLSQVCPEDIGAVVAVYGTSGGDFSTARAAYLGHFAENDDFEPLDGVRALEDKIRAAGRDVTFHVYPNTGHWFVEPNRPDVYDADAAELVWERTLTFLQTHLSGSPATGES